MNQFLKDRRQYLFGYVGLMFISVFEFYRGTSSLFSGNLIPLNYIIGCFCLYLSSVFFRQAAFCYQCYKKMNMLIKRLREISE